MHGIGSYHWANGSAYYGDWFEDDMHGKGRYFFVNGDIYDGDYDHDKRVG